MNILIIQYKDTQRAHHKCPKQTEAIYTSDQKKFTKISSHLKIECMYTLFLKIVCKGGRGFLKTHLKSKNDKFTDIPLDVLLYVTNSTRSSSVGKI